MKTRYTAMTPDQLTEAAHTCAQAFSGGRGVTFGEAGARLYMIPEAAARENGTGLIISLEGHGCYTYDGTYNINKFKLIQGGFPLQAADDIAWLVQAFLMIAANRPNHAQIAHQPESN